MSKTSSLFDPDTVEPLTDAADTLTQVETLAVPQVAADTDDDLPEGWARTKVGSMMSVSYGKGLVAPMRKGGNIPVYGSNGIVGYHNDAITTGPTIMIGRKGSVGEVHLCPSPCWPIDTTYFAEPKILNARFIAFILSSLNLSSLDTSTAIPGLNRDDLYSQDVNLPPLAEQQRIVDAIEAALTHVNTAREQLARVPKILKRFRQSVLAAACSGQLTADWREANPDIEPASVLLERIRAERKIKEGKKYKEPAPVDLSELEELPEGWEWCQPETITSPKKYSLAIGPFGSNLKVSDYTNQGVPLIFVRNIRSASFIGTNSKYVSIEKSKELFPHIASQEDILITKMGDPPGDACIYPTGNPDAVITADCIKWTINPVVGINVFFAHLVNSEIVKRQIADRTQGVAQQKISLERFKSVVIPLPPIEEQREIVRRVKRLFALADMLEKRVASATIRVEKTTQAVLAKAFRGELVPTEAELARQEGREYEPASVLLERIKTERSAETATKARRGRSSKKG